MLYSAVLRIHISKILARFFIVFLKLLATYLQFYIYTNKQYRCAACSFCVSDIYFTCLAITRHFFPQNAIPYS